MAYNFLTTLSSKGKNIYGTDLTNYMFYVDIYIEQSDATNNFTNVKLVAHIDYLTGSTTTSSTFYFKQDGSDYYYTYYKLGVSGNALYAPEKIVKYYHNQDGTKSININMSLETEYSAGANANLNNYVLKSASINQNITLPTINRISPFSFSGDFTMGTSKAITISPYVSSFRHTVSYAFGSASGTIGSNISTSVSWTPSKDLGYQIPNSTSGIGSITVSTYNGSNLIGSTSKTFRLWISGDMNPTFEVGVVGNDLFSNVYITKYSSVTLNINNAVGSYGSAITSYSISGEGISSSSNSVTTAKFNSSGTKTYILKITDSRGRTCTKTTSVNVYWYEAPKIEWVAVGRANDNKEPFDKGNYLFAQLNYEIANPSNSNTNQRSYSLEYKETSATSWTTLLSGNLTFYDVSDYECDTQQTFELNKSYDIRFTITDSLESTSITGVLPVATCIMDIEKTGVGIGKYHENGALDVSGNVYLNGKTLSEEGTFSPYFYVSEQGSGVYTRRQGEYIVFNGWCHCNISIVVEHFNPGINNNSQLIIAGLPFVNKGGYVACTIGYMRGIKHTTADTSTKCYVRPNDTNIVFVCTTETDGLSHTVWGYNVASDNYLDIQVSLTYKCQ